jgi:hypothetical protein
MQPTVKWIDDKGQSRLLQWDDVLIVSRYNAQVSDLWKRLPKARVGTVDNFSGSAGVGGDLLGGDIIARGCASGNGVSLQLESER